MREACMNRWHAMAAGAGAVLVLGLLVRACFLDHDVPFLVEDGQLFCKLCLESTAETPQVVYGAALQSHYQTQSLTLGKQFLPWDAIPPK